MSEDEYRIIYLSPNKGHTCVVCGASITLTIVDCCPSCGGNPFVLDKHEVFTKEQLSDQRAIRLGKKEHRCH